LAYPYGIPTILSSYQGFSDVNVGPPNSGVGTCIGTGGENGWFCQHRWIAISGMTGFRNNVRAARITDWFSPQSDQIAFGRESAGFVAINNHDSAWSATFTTSLADGSYCDVINGVSSSGSCTWSSFEVSGGSFSATVPARSAIAIHTGARGTGGTISMTVLVTATTTFEENVFLVGSLPQLGLWAPRSAIAMTSSTNDPIWAVAVSLPANTVFEYKFFKKEGDGKVVWENGPNRQATTVASGPQTIKDSWQF